MASQPCFISVLWGHGLECSESDWQPRIGSCATSDTTFLWFQDQRQMCSCEHTVDDTRNKYSPRRHPICHASAYTTKPGEIEQVLPMQDPRPGRLSQVYLQRFRLKVVIHLQTSFQMKSHEALDSSGSEEPQPDPSQTFLSPQHHRKCLISAISRERLQCLLTTSAPRLLVANGLWVGRSLPSLAQWV